MGVTSSGGSAGFTGTVYQYSVPPGPNPTPVFTRQIPVPDTSAIDFGFAVAISGDLIAVGDPLFRRNGLNNVGRVTTHSTATGAFQADFLHPNRSQNDRFGYAVALDDTDLDGSTVVRTLAAGAPSDVGTSSGTGNGRVFLFEPDNSTAVSATIQSPSNSVGGSDPRFGASLDLGLHYIAIGAPSYDSPIAQGDAQTTEEGTAYVYDYQNPGAPLGRLEATDSESRDNFASAILIDESTGSIIVGSPNSNSMPLTPDARGAVYRFEFRCSGASEPTIATPIPLRDCDRDGLPDYCEINDAGGTDGIGGTLDTDANGVLDLCEFFDCSSSNGISNGVNDAEDINMSGGINGIGGALDCNNNGIIDDCETDGAKTEVVAIVDTSGSMNNISTFNAIIDTLDEVEAVLTANGHVTGFIPVFGITESYAGITSSSVIADIGSRVSFSGAAEASIGSNEDWGDAVGVVAEQYSPFGSADRKLIIVFSDEGPEAGSTGPSSQPSACDSADDAAIDRAYVSANANDVAVFAVATPMNSTGDTCDTDNMMELANQANLGDWIDWNDASDPGTNPGLIAQRVLTLINSFVFTPTNDCNTNGIEDCVEVANGTEPDADGNGQPDGCQACNDADLAPAFGTLDLDDIAVWVTIFQAQDPAADLNNDGIIDLGDITVFVTAFEGGCP